MPEKSFSLDTKLLALQYVKEGRYTLREICMIFFVSKITLKAWRALYKFGVAKALVPSKKNKVYSKELKQNEDYLSGLFLMIEGSQIDWGAHDNDIVATMSEMEDFEQAFQTVIDFAKKDKETLVVMMADHSTGGFTMGANGQYNWFAEPVQSAERTPDYMAEEIANGAGVEETLDQYSGLDLAAEEMNSVSQAAKPVDGVIDGEAVDNAIEEIYNARSNSGWTTTGHTGEDVGVYAYGPMHTHFAGLIDNTDHAKSIFDILRMKK